jgi:hypothetical protein
VPRGRANAEDRRRQSVVVARSPSRGSTMELRGTFARTSSACRDAKEKTQINCAWTASLLKRCLEFRIVLTRNSIAARSLRTIETRVGTLHKSDRRPSNAKTGLHRLLLCSSVTACHPNRVQAMGTPFTPRTISQQKEAHRKLRHTPPKEFCGGCRARRLLFNSRRLTVFLDRRKKSHKHRRCPSGVQSFNTAA